MRVLRLKGKRVSGGYAEGEAVVSKTPISFTGSLDPSTGVIREPGHDLESVRVAGKILVFPTGKGSTTGSWQFYVAFKRGNAPKGLICVKADGIVAVSAILAKIPLIHELEENPLQVISTGDYIRLDADKEVVEVHKKE